MMLLLLIAYTISGCSAVSFCPLRASVGCVHCGYSVAANLLFDFPREAVRCQRSVLLMEQRHCGGIKKEVFELMIKLSDGALFEGCHSLYPSLLNVLGGSLQYTGI
jgi:hypothetical protein